MILEGARSCDKEAAWHCLDLPLLMQIPRPANDGWGRQFRETRLLQIEVLDQCDEWSVYDNLAESSEQI